MIISSHYAYTNDQCVICRYEMNDVEDAKTKGGVVAHEGHGKDHPFHRDCIIEWLKFSHLCPSCKVPIDKNVSMPWIDRLYLDSKYIKNDVMFAAVFGVMVAAQEIFSQTAILELTAFPIVIWILLAKEDPRLKFERNISIFESPRSMLLVAGVIFIMMAAYYVGKVTGNAINTGAVGNIGGFGGAAVGGMVVGGLIGTLRHTL